MIRAWDNRDSLGVAAPFFRKVALELVQQATEEAELDIQDAEQASPGRRVERRRFNVGHGQPGPVKFVVEKVQKGARAVAQDFREVNFPRTGTRCGDSLGQVVHKSVFTDESGPPG